MEPSPIEPAAELRTLVKSSLQRHRISYQGGSVVDLRFVPATRVIRGLIELVLSSRLVLHGSNFSEVFSKLEPRKANDASKSAGNRLAVYSTTMVDLALMYALFNRRFATSVLSSYTMGYRVTSSGVMFLVTDNLFDLFVSRDPGLWNDGMVYALDVASFARVEGSEYEYSSDTAERPVAAMRVSRNLRNVILRAAPSPKIQRYPLAERARIAAHAALLGCQG